MRNRVVVVCAGGVVQNVFCDDPNPEVYVVDLDEIEYRDEDDDPCRFTVPWVDGSIEDFLGQLQEGDFGYFPTDYTELQQLFEHLT